MSIKKVLRKMLLEVVNLPNQVNINLINQIPKGNETWHERINPDYYNELKDNIKKEGIKEPLVAFYYVKDNSINLSEGHHRLKIANELGFDSVPLKIVVVWDKEGWDITIFNPPIKLNIEPYIKRDYFPTLIKPSELGM